MNRNRQLSRVIKAAAVVSLVGVAVVAVPMAAQAATPAQLPGVSVSTGGSAKCEVVRSSDVSETLKCSDVGWQLVGDSVLVHLPSNNYRVLVQNIDADEIQWSERNLAFISENSGLLPMGASAKLDGGSVKGAKNGWNAGVDAAGITKGGDVQIEVTKVR